MISCLYVVSRLLSNLRNLTSSMPNASEILLEIFWGKRRELGLSVMMLLVSGQKCAALWTAVPINTVVARYQALYPYIASTETGV